MSAFSKSMSELIEKYKLWVCQNPEMVGFVENYSAFILSATAGKLIQSNIVYDWMSLGTRLLSLFHDSLINAPDPECIPESYKLKIYTTILKYAEVCLERTVQYVTGESGRWKLIVFLQCLKLFMKLTIRLHYNERIVCSPYLLTDTQESPTIGVPAGANGRVNGLKTHFVLKRSGRVVRMVHSAPPLYTRLWKPPVPDNDNSVNDKRLQRILLAGELLYLFKPIVTIGAIKKYGYGTWKPWTISLLMDLMSLYLINYPYMKPPSLASFKPSEREEIGRRLHSLILYMMRSPFYERYTEHRIKSLLSIIPMLGQVLQDHLDFLMQPYFYLWSD